MTKEQIEADLAEAYEARRAVLKGQKYKTSDGDELTRADLGAINETIRTLETQLSRLKRGGLVARKIIPIGV